MTLELTASRLIAKHVGSSLYTWTSVIGVVLAGITLGNWVGGWMADRFDRGRSLAWMYLIASISSAGILWLDQLAGTISRPDFLTWPQWILALVGSIFLLPAFALGATSPLVASMAIDRSSRTGSAIGNIYAFGALGSIVGTFVTGFYLIDVWGTRSIVGITSATLGILAAYTAGHRMLFRTAVMVGWLQLLGWTLLAATANVEAFGSIGTAAGNYVASTQSGPAATQTRVKYRDFATSIGKKFHEIGLIFGLRDDQFGDYRVESNYSDISISESIIDGRKVKLLRLDKLIHSYYDSEDPLKLHYSYEQAYAAVTKRVASLANREPIEIPLSTVTAFQVAGDSLPDGVTLDAGTNTLRIERPSNDLFTKLLELSPEAPYWSALQFLHHESNKIEWGGFSSVNLARLPQGVQIPEDVSNQLRHDETLQILIAYDPISQATRDRLIADTPSGSWFQAIERARKSSLKTSSCFYGGGGFIFPRWFLNEFPGSERIDVIELDPEVYRAVQLEMDFDQDQEQRIHTTIADARNFVEDRLQENQRRRRQQEAPINYDFIYSDAFNDFSIPWHLTTAEFLKKTRELLSERGVFLANIIDIFPRSEYPNGALGKGWAEFRHPLPEGVLRSDLPQGKIVMALPQYAPLEITSTAPGTFRLTTNREVTPREASRMKINARFGTGGHENASASASSSDHDIQHRDWIEAIDKLAAMSQQRVGISGSPPEQLKLPASMEGRWIQAVTPYEDVEILRINKESYLLGLRGSIPVAREKELVELGATDPTWPHAIRTAAAKSRSKGPGRFIGRYVATAATVFPNIYLFRSIDSHDEAIRDTFVLVCAQQPLNLGGLEETGDWQGGPFAWRETAPGQSEPTLGGQMSAMLSLAEGQILTDDYAPVDNLLAPVFDTQE